MLSLKVKLSSILFIMFTCHSSSVLAQSQQSSSPSLTSSLSQLQPNAINSLVTDIVANQSTLLAVGARGHAFIFNQQWQQVITPTNVLLTKAFLVTPNKGWAVGHDATIMKTLDAGHTWQLQMQSEKIEKPFLDVYFFNDQHGIAIGAYGLFYRTFDGGKAWQEEFHQELLIADDVAYLAELKAEDEALYLSEKTSILPHFNRIISLPDERLLMVGELGLIAVSSDKGRHWTKVDFEYEGSLFNAIVNDFHIYVMGLRGHVFRSDFNLSLWEKIQIPTQSTINGGVEINREQLRIVGNGGVIIDISRNGQSRLVNQRQGENLVSIIVDQHGRQWIAGDKGLQALDLQ